MRHTHWAYSFRAIATAVILTLASMPAILMAETAAQNGNTMGQTLAAAPLDTETHARLLNRAEVGAADAQLELGLRFLHGRSAVQSYLQAAHWLQRAAAQEIPEAQIHLAELYRSGLGVPQDELEAERLTALASASHTPPLTEEITEPTIERTSVSAARARPQQPPEQDARVAPTTVLSPPPNEAESPIKESPDSTPGSRPQRDRSEAERAEPIAQQVTEPDEAEPVPTALTVDETGHAALYHTLTPTHHFGERGTGSSALLQQVTPVTRDAARPAGPLGPDHAFESTGPATGTYRWVGSHQAYLRVATDDDPNIPLDIEMSVQTSGEQLFFIHAQPGRGDETPSIGRGSHPRHFNLTAEFP